MMSNNLGRGEQVSIPGAVGIADQGDVVVQATSLPTCCIDAQFGLNACDDEFLDAVRTQEVLQVGFVEGVGHGLFYDCIAWLGCNKWMNLPSLGSIFQRMAFAFASMLNVDDGDVGLTHFLQ